TIDDSEIIRMEKETVHVCEKILNLCNICPLITKISPEDIPARSSSQSTRSCRFLIGYCRFLVSFWTTASFVPFVSVSSWRL
ncbi:hypothetical protein PENTCL1PPCAC_12349, partial [Pristionchus entomophagus]